jgi:hypothetical protein
MLQHALGGDAISRIELQHRHQEIDTLCPRGRELGHVVVAAADGDVFVHLDVVGEGGDAGPVVLGGGADRVADGLELRHLLVAHSGGVGDAEEQLGEDHAHAPHVDGAAVVSGSE